MPWLRRTCLAAPTFLLALGLLAQDRVVLPNECGTLARLPGWTALVGEHFVAATPPTKYPEAEPARTMLTDAVARLRERKQEAEHALLHSPGTAPGTLRLVDAYSAGFSVTSADLHKPEATTALQKELAEKLTAPGVTVTFAGSEQQQLFAVGTLSLSFELATADRKWHVVTHVVPAGERIQYFETTFVDGDVDARGEIEALLRTYDGAREGRSVDFWRATLLGGGAGALAAILARVWMRRRQRAAAAGAP